MNSGDHGFVTVPVQTSERGPGRERTVVAHCADGGVSQNGQTPGPDRVGGLADLIDRPVAAGGRSLRPAFGASYGSLTDPTQRFSVCCGHSLGKDSQDSSSLFWTAPRESAFISLRAQLV